MYLAVDRFGASEEMPTNRRAALVDIDIDSLLSEQHFQVVLLEHCAIAH